MRDLKVFIDQTSQTVIRTEPAGFQNAFVTIRGTGPDADAVLIVPRLIDVETFDDISIDPVDLAGDPIDLEVLRKAKQSVAKVQEPREAHPVIQYPAPELPPPALVPPASPVIPNPATARPPAPVTANDASTPPTA